MRFRYEPLTGPSIRALQDAIFKRMQAEGLLGCAMSALPAPTPEDWRRITSPRRGLLLCCHAPRQAERQKASASGACSDFADENAPIPFMVRPSAPSGQSVLPAPWGKSGQPARSGQPEQSGQPTGAEPASRSLAAATPEPPQHEDMLGCALFTPRRGKIWEFDFTTFRAGAPFAVPLAHGCLSWAFAHLDCAAVMGLCPAPNRHAWRLAEACGFQILGRLPQACRHARKKRHVDGILVLCTPSTLANSIAKEAVMGFGGGYSAPSVPEIIPAPKQEVQKPVTEAATAARQAQKDKAAKTAGIGGSVHTSPLSRAEDARKTLLGQ